MNMLAISNQTRKKFTCKRVDPSTAEPLSPRIHSAKAGTLRVLSALLLIAAAGCDAQAPVSGEDEPPYDGPTTADPLVRFLWPEAGRHISSDTQIRVSATDDKGIAEVRFAVDGEPIAMLQEEPWEVEWKAEPWADGLWHQLHVGATDTDGNTAQAQISVLVIDPVPALLHAMYTDSSGSEMQYEAEVWLSRTARLDSIRIRELDGADWVSDHMTPFDGFRLKAGTRVAVPGNGETYPVVAPIYEITAYGRTAYFTEGPFEIRLRGRF